tara:strand:+ start:136 stop:567 length:432 start_codon:yes stop_codon:yes gene_type:complete
MVYNQKEYNKSPARKRSLTISQWKYNGIIHDQGLKYLYDNIYFPATNCKKCNIEFGSDGVRTRKSCDHNHSINNSHNFRAVLCNSCNVNDRVDNTSGFPNIIKSRKYWIYRKTTKGILHQKYFKSKEDAIQYKIKYEAGFIIS